MVEYFYAFWVFVFGLTIGSFLNVVILRAFSGESIVLPPSKCPHCKHKLAPWDNIPVFSYLFLRGKCRYCAEKISIQYPLVELFTAIMFVLIYLKYGLTLNALFLVIATALCIVMAVSDIKEKVIFDVHAYILGVLGLIYNFFNIAGVNTTKITLYIPHLQISIQQTFIYAVLGLFAGIIIMEALARIPQLFIGKRAFGEGDTFIAAALGAFFGIANLIVIVMLGLIFQILLFLPMYFIRLFKEKNFRLIVALLLFFAMTVIMYVGNTLLIFDGGWLYWFGLAVLISIGIYCCRSIVCSIKANENQTYLPFGPALILGAFVILLVL